MTSNVFVFWILLYKYMINLYIINKKRIFIFYTHAGPKKWLALLVLT